MVTLLVKFDQGQTKHEIDYSQFNWKLSDYLVLVQWLSFYGNVLEFFYLFVLFCFLKYLNKYWLSFLLFYDCLKIMISMKRLLLIIFD